MQSDPTTKQTGQGKAAWLSVVFLLMLWLPTLDWLLHLDHAPLSNEKRLMAEAPQFKGLGQLKEYLAGFELYFNDHFGFRKRLIRTNNHWKHQLFRDTPNSMVLVGPNGWLFSTSEKMLDHYLGAARFSQADLEAWQKLLEERRNWLDKRGAKYLFVIAPDKHSVYPEELPRWLTRSAQPTKVQQLVEHMKTHSTVQVLDLRPALVKAKPLGVNYLKTDSHWNALGGFIGYQAVVQALNRQLPGLSPLPLEAFSLEPVEAPGGDMADILGVGAKEPQQVRLTPRPPLPPLAVATVPDRLPKKWRKLTDPVVTENNGTQSKAVVFRDSFARAWYPFLGYHFKEVVYIWQYQWDAPFLEREKPDVVIDEIVERFFNNADPRELARAENLK
jgi:hypothetical protein